MLLKALGDRKFVFFGGKGGVGKTTIAAAFAMAAAEAGRRTLLFSTDPAHNLGDVLERRLKGEAVEVVPNLFGGEIDPDEEAERYIEGVREQLHGLVRPEMQQAVDDYFAAAASAPGAAEAALFDRIVSIVLDEGEAFRHVIFDTAPTGHTLRLLQLPGILTAWVEALVLRRENQQKEHAAWLGDGISATDRIVGRLQERRARFERTRSVLQDAAQTAFVFVLNPEKLPIFETARAVAKLEEARFPIGPIVINKLLPEREESPFLMARQSQQATHLAEIRERFASHDLLSVPLLPRDVQGLDALLELSKQIQPVQSWPLTGV